MKTDQPKAPVMEQAMLRNVIVGLVLAGGLALGAFGVVNSAGAQSGPFCSRFDTGMDGWAACAHAPNITVTMPPTGGSPNNTGGYLDLQDLSNASAACSTDPKYLGNWIEKVGGCGQVCFDFKVFHSGFPPAPVTPQFNIFDSPAMNVRAVFVANFTVTPLSNPPSFWRPRICMPINLIQPGQNLPSGASGAWQIGGSTAYNPAWNTLITSVGMVAFPVDYTGQPSEVVGYDNLCTESAPCAAALRLCKVAGPGVAVGTPFTFTAGTNTVTVPAGPPPAGTCVDVVDPSLTVGSNVTVTETIPANTTVSSIAVTPPGAMIGSPNLAGGSVNVTLGSGVTVVTFTDTATPPPSIKGCLEDVKVSVKCNPNGTYTVTLSGGSFTGNTILLTSQTPGVTVTPPQQLWVATTTWTITGATAGQTVTLTANVTKLGGGVAEGSDLCCSAEIKIVMPECPKGTVIVEKKVKNETHASTAAINALVFPIGLTCGPPSTLNTSFGLHNGQSHTENNIPYGSLCSVTEMTSTLPPVPKDACPQGSTAAWSTPVITVSPSATIGAPVTTFTVVNELKCVPIDGKTGRLSVTKMVSPDPRGIGLTLTFPMTVTCTSPNASHPLSVHGNTSTVPFNVPVGSHCTVTETQPALPAGCTWLPPVYSPPGSVTIASGLNQETVTNGYRCRDVCPPPQVMNAAGVCVCPPPMVTGATPNTCFCPQGTTLVNGKCVPINACPPPMVPGPVAGQCFCPPGTVQRGRECVRQIKCNAPMVPNAAGNVCLCPPGTVQKGRECVRQIKCNAPMVPNAAGNVCLCPPGTVQKGRECVRPTVCNPPAKLNRRGACECPTNMVARGNSCVAQPRQLPGVTPGRTVPGDGRDNPAGPRGGSQGGTPGAR